MIDIQFPKKNPDLSEALSQLRDWALCEKILNPDHQTAWIAIKDWAEGTAIKYRCQLSRPTLSSL